MRGRRTAAEKASRFDRVERESRGVSAPLRTVPAAERLEADRMSARQRLLWLLVGHRPDPAPARLGVLQAPPSAGEPARTGICCSGGGVRSASFNLGALQALQRRGVLDEAAYLSAVSGGSYIAAAWTMVRRSGGEDDSDPALLDAQPAFDRMSPEEQYLRNRVSYLAPGVLGKVELVHRVVLGLGLNLLSLFLLLLPAGVALGAAYRHTVFDAASGRGTVAVHDVVDERLLHASLVLAMAGVVLGAVAVLFHGRSDLWRTAREVWSLRLLVAAAALATVTIGLPALLTVLLRADRTVAAGIEQNAAATGALGTGSALAVVTAVLLQLRAASLEPDRVLESVGRVRDRLRRVGGGVRSVFVLLAATVAGPLLMAAVLVLAALEVVKREHDGVLFVAALASLALLAAMYRWTDLTSWSLHPFYRRRLCTAFALRRVRGPLGQPVACERDYDRPVKLSELPSSGPRLIVCAAANVSSRGATAPGRGVTSFTFEPTAMGGPLVGYVSTRMVEQALAARVRDFTLPAAVAMSGAALSPSMGKMTRPHLRFLLALANIRLGVWVPNPRWSPRWKAMRTDGGKGLRPRPSQLWSELFGRNAVNSKFLFVSDGGHYENLGLVELLRRGCTRIYCFDASGGPESALGSLGDAVALARSELGVRVEIDPTPMTPDEATGLARRDCVKGWFTYPDGTRGTLVVARTVLTPDASWDLLSLRHTDPRFPNHSTANQLFTDQKFEAYRELGWQAAQHAVSLQPEDGVPAHARPAHGAPADGGRSPSVRGVRDTGDAPDVLVGAPAGPAD